MDMLDKHPLERVLTQELAAPSFCYEFGTRRRAFARKLWRLEAAS
jgi:hypothetical protein